MEEVSKTKKGVALITVIIFLAVVMILTTASMNAVSFDYKQSISYEKQEKAYYLARSAVETVSKAVETEVNELNTCKTNLFNAIDLYNANPNNATDLTDYNNYSSALSIYNNKLNQIQNYVIPFGISGPYTHTINGITNISWVSIKPVAGGHRIEASATVNGTTAKAILNMSIAMNPESYQMKKHVITPTMQTVTETTTRIIPGNNPASFSDAIYTYGDLYLDNNIKLKKTDGTNADGRYRGKKDGKFKNIEGNISHDSSSTPPLDPKLLLPVNIDEDIRFTTMKTSLPTTITSANNGYYGNIHLLSNRMITVDTSMGDVILKLNRLELENGDKFFVLGNNYFYIYIDDNNLSDGGLVFSGNNTVAFQSHDNVPRTFIIVDQPSTDQTSSKNAIIVNNKLELDGYIFAPYSDLIFKNDADIKGGIVAGDVIGNNNLTIIQSNPNSGSNTGDGSGNQVITVTTTKETLVNVVSDTITNHSLSVIPLSISKSWLTK